MTTVNGQVLYREIIAVCSQIRTKHVHALCEQNVELLNVKLAVHIVTSEVKNIYRFHAACHLRLVLISRLSCYKV